jgi:hypothetical protein
MLYPFQNQIRLKLDSIGSSSKFVDDCFAPPSFSNPHRRCLGKTTDDAKDYSLPSGWTHPSAPRKITFQLP